MLKTLLVALGLVVVAGQAPASAQTQSSETGTLESTYQEEDEGMDWGWLGLLGLAGLAGLRRRDHHHHTDHTTRV